MSAISESYIRFGSICTREYKTGVDINPGVSGGPAVSLRWSFIEQPEVHVDDYECARPSSPKKLKAFQLTSEERMARLRSSGIAKGEIMAAMRKTNLAKQERRRTIEMMKNSKLHERMEGAKRKMKKMMRLQKSKEEEEEELWQMAQTYFSEGHATLVPATAMAA